MHYDQSGHCYGVDSQQSYSGFAAARGIVSMQSVTDRDEHAPTLCNNQATRFVGWAPTLSQYLILSESHSMRLTHSMCRGLPSSMRLRCIRGTVATRRGVGSYNPSVSNGLLSRALRPLAITILNILLGSVDTSRDGASLILTTMMMEQD